MHLVVLFLWSPPIWNSSLVFDLVTLILKGHRPNYLSISLGSCAVSSQVESGHTFCQKYYIFDIPATFAIPGDE